MRSIGYADARPTGPPSARTSSANRAFSVITTAC